MAAKTAAQEEFDEILAKSTAELRLGGHRDDARDYAHDRDHSDREEEETYRAGKVDENMKTAVYNGGGALRLPDPKFDSGRTTGVKGVIADARSYQEARKQNSNGWRSKLARGGSINRKRASAAAFLRDGTGSGSGSEDEEFLEQWREQRRLEMQREGNDIRKRRTSPSFRKYGRFDEVDALGYLDAIEKVGRDTVVVVFVYDADCPVSQVISDALLPLVAQNPAVHFVRVNYEEIEFDNAGVPAILAYKNQGDLFANLTYIIDQIPDDTLFDTDAMSVILRKHQVLA